MDPYPPKILKAVMIYGKTMAIKAGRTNITSVVRTWDTKYKMDDYISYGTLY